jgi:hypothetical protein
MYRYRVIVNDRPQVVELTHSPVRAAAGRLGVDARGTQFVDFWAEHDDDVQAVPRTFQVFGTGHQLPANARWCGTTERTPDGLVWHLYELTDSEESG